MKKVIIGLCVIVVVAVFGGRALYLHKQSVREKDVVKIGALLPMSGGSFDFIGPYSLDAMKIAEQIINDNNLYDFKIKIIPQDGKLNPTATINAFQKLRAEKINALIVLADTPTMAVSQFVQNSKMPTMALAGLDNIYDISDYLFPLTIKNKTMMPKLVKYAKEDLNIEKVAVFHIKVPMALQTKDAFIEYAEKNGITVTKVESFGENALEARSQVLKLLDTKPDALFIFGWNTAYVDAINYARQMGFTGPILTDMNIETALAAVKDKQNIFYVTTGYSKQMDEYGYIEKFKQKHNGEEPNVFNTFSYIGVMMAAEVVNGTDSNPDVIMQKLKQIRKHTSPFGMMEITEDGNIILPYVIKKISSDGSTTIVKE